MPACGTEPNARSVFADHFRNEGILRALKKYCKQLRLDARVEIETDRSSKGPLYGQSDYLGSWPKANDARAA